MGTHHFVALMRNAATSQAAEFSGAAAYVRAATWMSTTPTMAATRR